MLRKNIVGAVNFMAPKKISSAIQTADYKSLVDKRQPDRWSDCGQIFFTAGKAFTVANNLRTVCLGNKSEVELFLENGQLVNDLSSFQRDILFQIKEKKEEYSNNPRDTISKRLETPATVVKHNNAGKDKSGQSALKQKPSTFNQSNVVEPTQFIQPTKILKRAKVRKAAVNRLKGAKTGNIIKCVKIIKTHNGLVFKRVLEISPISTSTKICGPMNSTKRLKTSKSLQVGKLLKVNKNHTVKTSPVQNKAKPRKYVRR
jgi:hypothetical protein